MIKFVLSALVAVLTPGAFGCGISWSVPAGRFDGVDERGFVAYDQQIDEIDFGGGLIVPLIIDFCSRRESSSPYIGKGWVLALLDAQFVQTSEDAFEMTQPDGWVLPFYRTAKGSSVLDGGARWKAEIRDNVITAHATCGWTLLFTKGRITAIIAPKNRRLDFVRIDNRVVEIREGGAQKLAVSFDEEKHATVLSFNGKRLVLSQEQRPRVQSIAGQRVVGGIDYSLARIVGSAQATATTFDFAVNDQRQPTLKLSGERALARLFVWDSSSKIILADNGWRYKIAPPRTPSEKAAIERINDQGLSEYWFDDVVNGRETSQALNGPRRITHRYQSGALNGRVRRVEEIPVSGGPPVVTQRFTYGPSGELVRLYESGAFTTIQRSGREKSVQYAVDAPSEGALQKAEAKIVTNARSKEMENFTLTATGPNGAVVTYEFDPKEGFRMKIK